MHKPQEIFTPVAILCHRAESLSVSQNIFAIILLWEGKDVKKKRFNETVYKKDKEKKTKEAKTSAWGLNNV